MGLPMCGIAAILGELPADRADLSLRVMLDAQFHRGPDDDGSVVISTGHGVLALGNRRLAIQDVSALGHQPMRNKDTGDILVYNGEIYNSPQLRASLASEGYRFRGHSDTEILLRAYQHWGVECLDRLRGMFAFAIWDARRLRLVVARDHLGIKPLYYSCNEHWFVCASEVQALTKSGLISSDIDRRALAGYLAYGGVQEPLTIRADVSVLPRGSWKELDSCGKVVAEGTYWRFPPIQPPIPETSLLNVMEEGRALLRQSVSRHLLSDVRLGVFLSSGLDSTAILGLTRDSDRVQHIDAFTVSFPDRPQDDEVSVARATADRFRTTFNQCRVSDSTAVRWIGDALECMDQPSMDGFNTYIVSRAIHEQGIVVALSGLGGDEVFGGYNLFRRVPRTYDVLSWLNPLPLAMRIAAANLAAAFASGVARRKAKEIVAADPGLIGTYFHYRRLVSDFNLDTFGLNAKELDLSEDFQVRYLRYEDCYVPIDHVVSVGRLDAAFYLQNILLRDSDVFGMANSLEIRVPFLDRDLVEWAFRLPGNVLLPRRAPLKHLLRKICSDLYSKSQTKQPKRGFALPFAAWLRGPLRELMEENLRFLRSFGLVDPTGINMVRRLFEDDPNGPAWSRVWALVTLGSWLRRESCTCSAAEIVVHSA
jgi:asparagine synthase (glutamine-hydrolysing)